MTGPKSSGAVVGFHKQIGPLGKKSLSKSPTFNARSNSRCSLLVYEKVRGAEPCNIITVVCVEGWGEPI